MPPYGVSGQFQEALLEQIVFFCPCDGFGC